MNVFSIGISQAVIQSNVIYRFLAPSKNYILDFILAFHELISSNCFVLRFIFCCSVFRMMCQSERVIAYIVNLYKARLRPLCYYYNYKPNRESFGVADVELVV